MKNIFRIFILLIISFTSIYGQYSNKNWIFGNHAGLNFNQLSGGYPTPLTGSQLNTQDGVACISDENGNLLFYSEGNHLWDYNHVLLTSSLKGDSDCTQSAIVVPNPGMINNSRDYYLFTVDAWGASSWTNPFGNGIYYSIVNVNFNSPVTVSIAQENIPLRPNISFRENLMAVSKVNSPGYWVISKQYATNNTTGNNTFYVWEVTATGVDTVPQIYNIGSVQNTGGSLPGNPTYNGSVGFLKISPDGNILALANNYLNSVELYRFDAITGAVLPFVTTGNTILSNITRAYGIEFSPNSQLLYVSRTYSGIIYQFDLNSANIANSMTTLTPQITGTDYIKGAMQLGPDNRIYVVKCNSNTLAVINDPNVLGNGCNLVANGVTLASGALGRAGLPTFVPTKIQVIPTNDIDIDESVSIYPNPSTDILNFNYPKDLSLILNFTTVDNKSVLIKKLSAGQHEINIESLPNAVYFMNISLLNRDNKTVKTLNRKIVKISQ